MPVYAYRCRACGLLTDEMASVDHAPEQIRCEHCSGEDTHRIISRVAYHASEASRTARLDPKYEKMVDHAMKQSESADLGRLLNKAKPYPTEKNR